MTLPAFLHSARSLSYYIRLQQVTANNLANASSDGYKADRLVAHGSPDGVPVPVQALDLQQGTMRDTGRTLDVALDGKGFLVVSTPDGDRLTRGGSLSLDGNGILVDRHGDTVLGVDGPIHARGRDIVIDRDGTVMVDGARAGRLRIDVPKDVAALKKEGAGRFFAESTTPAHDVSVQQGRVEEANVNTLLGMVDMLSIQRAYAANTDVLKIVDGVLGTVTGELGRVSP